jgi:hypothetical protein
MDQFARTIDLPILLPLATELRRLAAIFPLENAEQRGNPMQHRPVDMTI